MRMRVLSVVAAMVLIMAAGCAGSDQDDDEGMSQEALTETTAAAALHAPIHPRCGLEGFGEPQVLEIEQFGGWRLVYTYPAPRPPQVKGMTTTLNLDQRPPDSPRLSYKGEKGGRALRINGRKVDFLRRENAFSAQWITKRARYVALGNGSGGILRTLVRCTP